MKVCFIERESLRRLHEGAGRVCFNVIAMQRQEKESRHFINYADG